MRECRSASATWSHRNNYAFRTGTQARANRRGRKRRARGSLLRIDAVYGGELTELAGSDGEDVGLKLIRGQVVANEDAIDEFIGDLEMDRPALSLGAESRKTGCRLFRLLADFHIQGYGLSPLLRINVEMHAGHAVLRVQLDAQCVVIEFLVILPGDRGHGGEALGGGGDRTTKTNEGEPEEKEEAPERKDGRSHVDETREVAVSLGDCLKMPFRDEVVLDCKMA